MNKEHKLVKVEFIDEALRSYGRFGYFDEEKALLGESKGKWKIVKNPIEDQSQYETRVMYPNLNILEYETKKPAIKPSTKNVKKKKIAWVHDEVVIGGAELTNYETIRIGKDCGFEITVINSSFKEDNLKESLLSSDLIILNNIWSFNEIQMRIILNAIYSNHIPYVKFEHDHRELDRLKFSRPLFQNSRLNIFLSPKHLENHTKIIGCSGICLPLAIDTEHFSNHNNSTIERKNNTALVCNVRHFKSWNKLKQFIDLHKELQFDIISHYPIISADNVRIIPSVPYKEMPNLYRQYEYLVHLLDGYGAGERVIFEASLCGCKVISDEKAGHMSWKKNLADTEELTKWLTQAPFEFWKQIDRVL